MTLAWLPVPLALAVGAALLGVLPAGTARAQQPAAPAAPPVPAPPYRDRIIAADALQDLPPDEDDAIADADGLPRSLRAEVSLSRNERGDDSFTEQGLAVGGFWESDALGSFSLDVSVFDSKGRRSPGDLATARAGGGATATLWQRNLFLDGGWRVDNGLGVLNTPALGLQRNQYRFFLPSVAFAGASTEWRREAGAMQVQAAAGRAGYYTGARAVGFEPVDGDVVALGAQWGAGTGWSAMASFLGSHGRLLPDAFGGGVLQPGNTRALHLATAWEGGTDTAQLNVLGSDGDRGAAIGTWLDGSARRGRYRHHYGAFYFGPDLAWGALPINNDIEGGYYRLAYQYGRWLWSTGLDAVHSISSRGTDAVYGTGYLRYQASNSFGYGGSLNLRRSPQLAHSAQLFADKRTRWGQTRMQLDQAGGNGDDSWQVAVDHALALRQGRRLSASLGYGEIARDGVASTSTTVALYGSQELGDRVSLDGSARWTQGDGATALRGTDLNVGVTWRIAPRWLVSATVYQSQGSQRSPFILDPLATQTPFIGLPRERSAFLILRYERHAGRPQAVLSGAPGVAAGAIAGSVFLDDNADGLRAASEQPAVNITVVLDGRYSVRTDSLGRFEFPRVAVGAHTVTVVPDNLPLPWSLDAADAERPVQVGVRSSSQVDVGARRPR